MKRFWHIHDWTSWSRAAYSATTEPAMWKAVYQIGICLKCGAVRFRHVRSDMDTSLKSPTEYADQPAASSGDKP